MGGGQQGGRDEGERAAMTDVRELLEVGVVVFFFFNGPATTENYTLSLPDALPIFISDKGSPFRTCPVSRTTAMTMGTRRG